MSIECQRPVRAPRLGAHLSLGRNPRASLEEAELQGAQCAQIFASSPGAWKPPVLDPVRCNEIRRAAIDHSIQPVVIHAIYLINLASQDPVLVRRSIESLVATLHAGAMLGVAAVVTHIGSHGGRGFDAVADDVAGGLREVLARTPAEIDLLLENSAGAGGIIGASLKELGELLTRAGSPPRLGVTLDTAHLCGAGWDLAASDAVDRLVAEVDSELGLERLRLIHANDSLTACGSHRDRHAIIGQGHIGLDGFRRLLADPTLTSVPWILETPDLGSEERPERFSSLRSLAVLIDEVAPALAGQGAPP